MIPKHLGNIKKKGKPILFKTKEFKYLNINYI